MHWFNTLDMNNKCLEKIQKYVFNIDISPYIENLTF